MQNRRRFLQKSPVFLIRCARFLARILQPALICLLAFSILSAPDTACSYAALALRLWFENMIPSLFPFMILSGLIVRLRLDNALSRPVYPVIGRLYRVNGNMCTAMLLGFLFGFPLGAKTVAEQYRFGHLTKAQAQYLLTFCNNIGPVYLLSFALPLLGFSGDTDAVQNLSGHENAASPQAASILSAGQLKSMILLLYFAIPLLYGLILRYTRYRFANFTDSAPQQQAASSSRGFPRPENAISTPPLLAASSPFPERPALLPALDYSIASACGAIAKLGGYMIFFMVCNTLLQRPFFSAKLRAAFAILLEITSGLSLAKDVLPLPFLLAMLTFGGFSCFAQTYACIRESGLSFRNYCFHKLLQSAIAFCLYALFFSFFC